MPVDPVTTSSNSAAALGGPVESTFDFKSFFNTGGTSPKHDGGLLGSSEPKPAGSVSNQSVQIPGANGAPPTLQQTSSTTVTDPGSGVATSVTNTNTGSGFDPTSVEVSVPLAHDGNTSVNAIAGARTDDGGSLVTGAGVQYTSNNVTAGVQFRAITPTDPQTPGFNELRADVTAGTSPKVSAGVTVTDKPGSADDSTEVRASVTMPINNDVNATVSTGYVIRPGAGSDGVGVRLQVGTPDVFGEVRVDQNNTPAGQGETVGQVQVGINF